MGTSSSKVDQLNKSITNVTTEVVATASASAAGSVISTQNLVFAGTGSNIDILQDSKIRLDVLQNSDVNAGIQAEILSKIIAEVNKTKSGLPEISSSKSDTEIRNIIENNIASTFNQESLAQLSLSIEMSQEIAFLKGSAYDQVRIAQTAEGVGKLINDMSGSITSQLVANTDIDSKATEVTENPVAGVVVAVGAAISNITTSVGAVFGLDPTTILFLIVVVIAGYFLAKKQMDRPRRKRRKPL